MKRRPSSPGPPLVPTRCLGDSAAWCAGAAPAWSLARSRAVCARAATASAARARAQGPAVWALRAQTDKLAYSREMRRVLEGAEGLHIREGMATRLILDTTGAAAGLETHFGMRFAAAAVILTTGTFMNGKIWVGRTALPAGRCAPPLRPRCCVPLASAPWPPRAAAAQ